MSAINEGEQALRNLFPGFLEDFPNQLRTELELLLSRSRYLITQLKPEQEAARSLICAFLAFEKIESRIQDAMMGHVPNTQRAPLPPFQFKSLTNVFRSALFPNEAFPEPVTSKAKSPRKQTRKTTRNSVSIEGVHTVSPTKRNSQTYEPTVSFSTAEPFGQEVSSTMKGAKGKRAPRSTSLKGSKSNDPTKQQIIALCTGMKVHNAVTPAILKSYRIYNNLVKDKWGLLCGIVVIVASKAQPRLIEGNSQAFYTRLKNMTNVDQDRLDEWIRWAASIINDQSWIKKVTDPNAKGITFKKEYKKYSSGIGNMISGTMSFTSSSRIEEYLQWKQDLINSLE